MRWVTRWVKKLGAFGAGVFVGVCYGSIVSTLTCVTILGLP